MIPVLVLLVLLLLVSSCCNGRPLLLDDEDGELDSSILINLIFVLDDTVLVERFPLSVTVPTVVVVTASVGGNDNEFGHDRPLSVFGSLVVVDDDDDDDELIPGPPFGVMIFPTLALESNDDLDTMIVIDRTKPSNNAMMTNRTLDDGNDPDRLLRMYNGGEFDGGDRICMVRRGCCWCCRRCSVTCVPLLQ